MTGKSLRANLSDLGMSQATASRLLGVRTTTMNRWVTGVSPVPVWLECFMDILMHCPDAAMQARRMAQSK